MASDPKPKVDSVFTKLGFKSQQISPKEYPMEMPHSPEEAHDRVAHFTFQSRINAIMQRHGKRGDDWIFLLDLSGLRQGLGDTWEKLHGKIHTKIHQLLEDALIAHDIYMQRDDTSYFVVISGLEQTKAQLKIRMIAEDIGKAVTQNDRPGLIAIKDVKVSWPNHVTYDDTPARDTIIREMLAKEDAHREFVFSHAGDDSSTVFDDIKFIFRPMLAVRTRIISTYVCIPIKADGHGGYASGYDILGTQPSIDNIYKLDCLTQDAVESELKKLVERNMRSLLALPVHFETLASHRRQNYLTRARELFQDYTSRIVFELVGVPDHIPQSRMLEFTAALKPHCRAIIARFPPSHGEFEAYRSVGLHAVGIDLYAPDKTEKNLFKSLEQFIEHAHQTQLRTYAHGIHRVSLYTAAVCAGFDYLDGYALSSVVDEATDIESFSYDMLYRDIQAPKSQD